MSLCTATEEMSVRAALALLAHWFAHVENSGIGILQTSKEIRVVYSLLTQFARDTRITQRIFGTLIGNATVSSTRFLYLKSQLERLQGIRTLTTVSQNFGSTLIPQISSKNQWKISRYILLSCFDVINY